MASLRSRYGYGGGAQVQRIVLHIVGNLVVFGGGLLVIQHVHLLAHDVQRHHLVVLGQQHGVGKAHVAGSGYGDLHRMAILV